GGDRARALVAPLLAAPGPRSDPGRAPGARPSRESSRRLRGARGDPPLLPLPSCRRTASFRRLLTARSRRGICTGLGCPRRPNGRPADARRPIRHPAEERMKETMPVLNLEVEEIETRERAGGNCTSSTTSRHCTCLCRATTTTLASVVAADK